MLLVPELEQTRRGGRLDSTDRIQIVDIGGSQPLAVDLIGADEEISPPVELWAEIEGQAEVRQSFIDQACRTPPLTLPRNSSISVTAGIMPRLVSSDRSPPIIAQKQFCRISAGRWWGGRARRRFVGRRSHVGPDRGEQYRCRSGLDHCSHDQIIATTVAVIVAVASQPMICSAGGSVNPAMADGLFATLECELLERRRFASQAEAKIACFSFIEGWSNPARLHSALGYRSPIAYEHATEVQSTKA